MRLSALSTTRWPHTGWIPAFSSAENAILVSLNLEALLRAFALAPASLETCESTAFPRFSPPLCPFHAEPLNSVEDIDSSWSSPFEYNFEPNNLVIPLSVGPVAEPDESNWRYPVNLPLTSFPGADSFTNDFNPLGNTISRPHPTLFTWTDPFSEVGIPTSCGGDSCGRGDRTWPSRRR